MERPYNCTNSKWTFIVIRPMTVGWWHPEHYSESSMKNLETLNYPPRRKWLDCSYVVLLLHMRCFPRHVPQKHRAWSLLIANFIPALSIAWMLKSKSSLLSQPRYGFRINWLEQIDHLVLTAWLGCWLGFGSHAQEGLPEYRVRTSDNTEGKWHFKSLLYFKMTNLICLWTQLNGIAQVNESKLLICLYKLQINDPIICQPFSNKVLDILPRQNGKLRGYALKVLACNANEIEQLFESLLFKNMWKTLQQRWDYDSKGDIRIMWLSVFSCRDEFNQMAMLEMLEKIAPTIEQSRIDSVLSILTQTFVAHPSTSCRVSKSCTLYELVFI